MCGIHVKGRWTNILTVIGAVFFFLSIALTFRTICGKFSKCWQLFSSSTMKIKLDAHSNWKHQQLFESRVESSNNNNTNTNGNTSRCAEFYCCIAALASPSHSIQFRFPFPHSLPLIATLPTSVFKVLLFFNPLSFNFFSSYRKWSGTSSYSCEYPLCGMNTRMCDTLVFNGFGANECVIYLNIYIIGIIN